MCLIHERSVKCYLRPPTMQQLHGQHGWVTMEERGGGLKVEDVDMATVDRMEEVM